MKKAETLKFNSSNHTAQTVFAVGCYDEELLRIIFEVFAYKKDLFINIKNIMKCIKIKMLAFDKVYSESKS